jgi:hypothetical protein
MASAQMSRTRSWMNVVLATALVATAAGASVIDVTSAAAAPSAPASFQFTYNATGSPQTYTVPGGVTTLTFTAYGAQGSAGCSSGGRGGSAQSNFTVTPGQVFTFAVGGEGSGGSGGYNGGGNGGATAGSPIGTCVNPGPGGGGGATDVRSGGTTLADRVLVAGGGGGGSNGAGGDGGGLTGTNGTSAMQYDQPAGGGSQIAGGTGGAGFRATGSPGLIGQGGNGGGSGAPGAGGGGGGGGYYGGGGGGADYPGNGAGGGSGFGPAGTTFANGVQIGSGKIVVSFTPVHVLTATVHATQTYGGTPTYAVTYSGFVDGDGPSAIGGSITCSSVTPTVPVGTPNVTGCSGLTSTKYYIFYDGQLTVSPAPLTATVSGTQVVGGTPAYTASYSAFVNGDTPSVVTGTLSCTTSATPSSPVGDYTISNCSGLSSPNYAITYAYGNLAVQRAATITSAPATTFTVGSPGSFTLTTGAAFPPATALTEQGTLPSGVTFIDNKNGTASLAGTPAIGTGATYPVSITATNGVNPPAVQPFTLTVNETPTITSAKTATFTVGSSGTLRITTGHDFPTATTLSETGALPGGVTFTDNNDGTATLTGTPAVGTGNTYPLVITATNGVVPDGTQNFTLVVNEAVAITSAAATTMKVGTDGSFTVTTAHAYPVPTLSEVGELPDGVQFVDLKNGTARLSGNPEVGAGRVYTFTVTASNGVGTAPTQTFTLTVNEAVLITSPASASFSVGINRSFAITTSSRFPRPTTLIEVGTLPNGLTFTDKGNGTATVAGTPAAGSKGTYPVTVIASNGITPAGQQPLVISVNSGGVGNDIGEGYWMTGADGGVFSFGDAQFFGSTGSLHLNQPVVGMAPSADSGGYYLVARDGGVFSFGDAQFYGSVPHMATVNDIVAMILDPATGGYWVIGADGQTFAFNAPDLGNAASNAAIVGAAATPTGGGYWLVAADGGVFSFGDAQFFGSMGGQPLNQPIVGMAPTPDGGGYWLVAADGGVFAFGDAVFAGSMGSQPLNQPMVAMVSNRDGGGYWLVAADGGVFSFGGVGFAGSMGGKHLNSAVVGAVSG